MVAVSFLCSKTVEGFAADGIVSHTVSVRWVRPAVITFVDFAHMLFLRHGFLKYQDDMYLGAMTLAFASSVLCSCVYGELQRGCVSACICCYSCISHLSMVLAHVPN